MEMLEAIGNGWLSMAVKQSTTGYTAALAIHSIGMAFVVGISTVIAMRVVGFFSSLPLAPLENFCPLMTAGFWSSAITGVVLLISDPVRLVPDLTLYIKMGAIVGAMVLIRRLRALIFDAGATPESQAAVKQAKPVAISLLAAWGVAIVSGKVMAYDWPVEVQSAIAALIFTGVTLLVGRFLLGWGRPPEQQA